MVSLPYAQGGFMPGTAGGTYADGTGGFNFESSGNRNWISEIFLRKGGNNSDEYIVRAFPNTALKDKKMTKRDLHRNFLQEYH